MFTVAMGQTVLDRTSFYHDISKNQWCCWNLNLKWNNQLVFRDHVTRNNSIEYRLDTPNAKTKEVKPPLSDLCCVIPMWRHQVAQTGKVGWHSPLHDLSGYPLL